MYSRNHQLGRSLTSFLLTILLLVVLFMPAIKVSLAYLEFFSVQQIIKAQIGGNPNLADMSDDDIRKLFTRAAAVGDVKSVKASDLIISRDSTVPVISVGYSYETPLVGNVSLQVDFYTDSVDK